MDDKLLRKKESQRRFLEKHPEYNKIRAAEFRKKYPEKIKATMERMYARREALIREAKNKPCADCGICYPSYVMDFDHVRGDKINLVSQLRRVKLETIMEEIAKCDVVCANCHRERTHKQGYC